MNKREIGLQLVEMQSVAIANMGSEGASDSNSQCFARHMRGSGITMEVVAISSNTSKFWRSLLAVIC